MTKQVKWTSDLITKFANYALLSDDEVFIMKTRCSGMTVTQQSMKLNKSEVTIHRMIRLLKCKYDTIQAEHPDEFPVRKASAKELYMDTH